MARTLSNMMPLGSIAHQFELPDTISGEQIALDQLISSRGILIVFMCNHCPYVIHIIKEFVNLSDEFIDKGISVVAINSNDIENYPDDSPELMKSFAQKYSIVFPYLYDESQEVAKAYDAACTPDFFLFDKNKELVYRGRFDESRPKSDVPVTGLDLRNAIQSLLDGSPISEEQYPSMGCNIKWKTDRQ